MTTSRSRAWTPCALGALSLAFVLATAAQAQEPERPRQVIKKDSARVELLYVSDDWEDHPVSDYARDIQRKATTDSIYAAVTKGVVDFKKIKYRSRIGDLEIPAYLFQP